MDLEKRVILGGVAAAVLTGVLIAGVVALAPGDSRPEGEAVPPAYAGVEAPAPGALDLDPEALYRNHCLGCHGPDATERLGVGGPRWLYWRISEGKRNTRMPAFKDTLSDEERWALVRYLRGRMDANRE